MSREPQTDLQALITGAIMGALMKAASGDDAHFLIDVEPVLDEQGYLPEVRVRGRQSGECLLIRVELDLDREAVQL
jgi:hypothetical protein